MLRHKGQQPECSPSLIHGPNAASCPLHLPPQGSASSERLKAEVELAREESAELRRVRLPLDTSDRSARRGSEGATACVCCTAACACWVLAHANLLLARRRAPHATWPQCQACFELQEQLEAQRSAVAESNAALAAAQSQIRRLEVRGWCGLRCVGAAAACGCWANERFMCCRGSVWLGGNGRAVAALATWVQAEARELPGWRHGSS